MTQVARHDPPRALADNRERLVGATVRGVVALPRVDAQASRHDREGRVVELPGSGGVHPDVHLGDLVDRWLGDHLMVGIGLEDAASAPAEPGALHLLACLGNRVRAADGTMIGVVAGKRGGLAPGFMAPHVVSVEASGPAVDTLAPGAPVFVETIGRGLELLAHPHVAVMNCAPALLDGLLLEIVDERLVIPVRLVVPARAAGAGLGQDGWIGDLEIADPEVAAGATLRFGDLVAFADIDGAHGRFYRRGTISVGVVAHGPSPVPGHGVGVTMLLAGSSERLAVRIVGEAGVAHQGTGAPSSAAAPADATDWRGPVADAASVAGPLRALARAGAA